MSPFTTNGRSHYYFYQNQQSNKLPVKILFKVKAIFLHEVFPIIALEKKKKEIKNSEIVAANYTYGYTLGWHYFLTND